MKKLVSITFNPEMNSIIGLDSDGLLWEQEYLSDGSEQWVLCDVQFDVTSEEESE